MNVTFPLFPRLLRGIQQKDTNTLMKSDVVDQLFTQHYNEALLYTISLCKNRTVAEDIVSTAFFRALTMSDDSVRNFKPWLLTVCRNEYYSLCRKESRLTGEEIPEELEDNVKS